jgi:hypothetical protein
MRVIYHWMIHYFLILHKHKNLALKRKSDYKRNLIIAGVFVAFIIVVFSILFAPLSAEDLQYFSVFLLPAIIVLDFSLRFFLKENTSVAIVLYLTLPIPRKNLILYIILSDLLHLWIWGCVLIYSIILWYSGVLTFGTAITLGLFILLNNYLIAFIKAFTGGYAILMYPIGIGLVVFLFLAINLLNPIVEFATIVIVLVSLIVALFFTLKENLYKELSCFAL